MHRLLGIGVGLGVHAWFAVVVVQLFRFLYGQVSDQPEGWLWLDAVLALQFAVVHSLLLYPSVRSYLTRHWIPGPFYGVFFCAMTCLGLEFVFLGWQTSPVAIWALEGHARTAMETLFGLSWVALFYSLHLTGLGYQTGWTPWWHWFRRQPQPRRSFQPSSVYLLLRHPVYLSFLGLVWFTPYMTLDRVILTAIWTIYIFVGSWLKDRRLAHFMGADYRTYASRVPGYPGMPGSLGRWLPDGERSSWRPIWPPYRRGEGRGTA